jgi:hypothetical protein
LHAITTVYGEHGLRARFAIEIARIDDATSQEKISEALELAGHLDAADRRQRESYINHLLRVALRIIWHYNVRDPDIICAALLHDVVEDHATDLAVTGRNGAFAVLATRFGPQVAALVEAVTNPAYLPGRDEDEQYRAHVAASLAASPAARVIKVSDFTDNGIGVIHTTGPKAVRLARKYAPLVPTLADLIARQDTPLAPPVKARILDQLRTAQQRFAAIDPPAAAGPSVLGLQPMGSTKFACVGLAVADSHELGHLVYLIGPSAELTGEFNGIRVMRWQDPSGASLVLGCRENGDVVDLLPTYAAKAGGILADCRLISESVALAAVVDQDGEQLTAMAFEPEQYWQIKTLGEPAAGHARITALGVSVHVHADANAYAASPDSLFDPSADPADGVRMGAGSFISYGAFAEAGFAAPTAYARLAGTVLSASHRKCALTGQGFSVATVLSAGFAADVCLSDDEHPVTPAPGNIISGTVFLTAAFEA